MQLFTFLCMEGKKIGVKSAQKMANCGEKWAFHTRFSKNVDKISPPV